LRTKRAGAAKTVEGWIDLTFAREKDGERRTRGDRVGGEGDGGGSRPPRRKKRPDAPELGSALRSAYQQTVEERIPDDLLDLLGKLS
jgi:hypothetical protein